MGSRSADAGGNIVKRFHHACLSCNSITARLDELAQRGQGAFEAFDGHRLVWVEVKTGRNGHLYWSVNERRIARSAIPRSLGADDPG